jgi:hypothetical protein
MSAQKDWVLQVKEKKVSKEKDEKIENSKSMNPHRQLDPIVWGSTYWRFLFQWSLFVDKMSDKTYQKYKNKLLIVLMMLPDLLVCLMCETHLTEELIRVGDVMKNLIEPRKVTEWLWKLRTRIQKRQMQEEWNATKDASRVLVWKSKIKSLSETITDYQSKSNGDDEVALCFFSFVLYSKIGETNLVRLENLRVMWKHMHTLFPQLSESVIHFCSSVVKTQDQDISNITMKIWIESIQKEFKWTTDQLAFFAWYL